MFSFQARWKEELVVRGPGGDFVLELPMGILSAYLPTEKKWAEIAPDWAKPLYSQLKEELEIWCKENGARFFIDESASVYLD